MEETLRTVEPMTLAFRWRAWYLYGYCRFRQDYRLFRISRIRDPEILPERFSRRALELEEFLETRPAEGSGPRIRLVLKFAPEMRSLVEEFIPPGNPR